MVKREDERCGLAVKGSREEARSLVGVLAVSGSATGSSSSSATGSSAAGSGSGSGSTAAASVAAAASASSACRRASFSCARETLTLFSIIPYF